MNTPDQMTTQALEQQRESALARLSRLLGVDRTRLLSTLPIPPLGMRASHFVLTRESTAYDRLLLRNMHDNTLGAPHLAGLPGVEAALVIGITPLDKGQNDVPAVAIHRYRNHIAIYEVGGVWFMLSGASGALTDDKGENFHSEVLCAVLDLLRPVEASAAYVARLGRSIPVLNKVQNTFINCTDLLHVEGQHLNMGDPMGHMVLSILMTMAASERDQIVRRLTIGKIYAYRRNRWILGSHAVPYGYKLVKKRLVLDDNPETIRRVRAALALTANPDLNTGQLLQRYGDLGLKTRKKDKNHPELRDLSEVPADTGAIRGFTRWADLYRTGTAVIEHRTSITNADSIVGMPIDTDEHGRLLRFVYSPGVPDGGWGSDDILTAVAARRTKSDFKHYGKTGGQAHKTRLPLLGLAAWIGGGRRLRLISRSKGAAYNIVDETEAKEAAV